MKAKRYVMDTYDSSMDWIHGNVRVVQEVHLPDFGVVVNVINAENGVIANAFPCASPRNANESDFPSPLEDVEIPDEIADEIRKLSELTAEVNGLREKIGKHLVDSGVISVNPERPQAWPRPGPNIPDGDYKVEWKAVESEES